MSFKEGSSDDHFTRVPPGLKMKIEIEQNLKMLTTISGRTKANLCRKMLGEREEPFSNSTTHKTNEIKVEESERPARSEVAKVESVSNVNSPYRSSSPASRRSSAGEEDVNVSEGNDAVNVCKRNDVAIDIKEDNSQCEAARACNKNQYILVVINCLSICMWLFIGVMVLHRILFYTVLVIIITIHAVEGYFCELAEHLRRAITPAHAGELLDKLQKTAPDIVWHEGAAKESLEISSWRDRF
jgi:hypothetical protein